MVRSHIGNVVCRKALCVRVASSPPRRRRRRLFRCLFFILLSKSGLKGMPRKIEAELTTMCMVTSGSKVLVQNRQGHGWPGIAFPGGHLENEESITDSVIREVREETGLTISSPRLCGIKDWYSEQGFRYIVFLYRAEEFSGELKASEEGEVFWAERNDLPGMNLCSGMEETFQVFFDDALSELYYEDNDSYQIF